MPEYTTIFAALGLLIVLLGIVLTIDFFFRQDVYDRSDPLSFAILLYSFLLVATDTGLNIMSQITAKDVNVPLIISGACYLAVVYVVFQFAKFAHKKFKKAQVDKIKKYLKSIRASSSAPDAV